jgi:peptidoglycan hydrolase CwlO-like protein
MAFAMPIQMFSARPVSADEYDAKIQALNDKIAGYQKQANDLRAQANTLQNTLDQLSADKAGIQTQIDLYQTQYDQLVSEIDATQKRIDENRRTSGDLIVRSSLSEDIPLIVRLAASENLADYIDGEASRISVRDTLVQKTEENNRLKKELVTKQDQVKKVLDEQKFKRGELAAKEATQAELLRQTQGNEAAYQNMIASSQAQIQQLRAAQEALRKASQNWGGGYVTIGGSGGYPWAGVGYPCWSAGCGDPWGLYYRECVSYVAWKLDSTGRGVRNFRGAGNATEWPSTTRGYTSQTRGVPHVGDAAVIPAGVQGIPWTGHVMFVEEIYGDGSILISEYNFDGRGSYSERKINAGTYSPYIFITFPSR